jgi:virginiamycin B lyase
MKSSGLRSRLAALLTAIAVFVGLLSLSSAPAWATAGTITEFPVPKGSCGPIGITVGSDGNLWFTAGTDIGRITTKGHVTGFPIPSALGGPQFITAGPDGKL